jgi:benzoylformate decarboxylase
MRVKRVFLSVRWIRVSLARPTIATNGWVASFVGDGGAMYSPHALWSAARYRARTTIGRCGVLQNIAKSPGYLNAKAGRFVGMDVPDPSIDFLALAASMGVPSERAHDRGAIGAAIARALKRGGPVADGNPNPLKA